MASIVTQLRNGKADVHHRGYDLKDVEFPEYILEMAEVVFNKERLLEVLERHNITLNILHLGLSEFLVKWRAAVRPSDTNEKPKEILDEEDEARERGRTFIPSLLPNPDEAKTTKGASKAVAETVRKLTISLAGAGVPWDTARGIIEGAGGKPDECKSTFDRVLEG